MNVNGLAQFWLLGQATLGSRWPGRNADSRTRLFLLFTSRPRRNRGDAELPRRDIVLPQDNSDLAGGVRIPTGTTKRMTRNQHNLVLYMCQSVRRHTYSYSLANVHFVPLHLIARDTIQMASPA